MSTNATRFSLDTMTVEVEDFIRQFNEELSKSGVWKGELVTQTSQSLIEFISTVGTFDQARVLRASEDAYAETAQSDDAILAIAQMQGLRLTRKGPAAITVELQSDSGEVTVPPYTQFMVGGTNYFNREQLVIDAPNTYTLYQGFIKSVVTTGLSTDYQAFVGPTVDDAFRISDEDVQVRINGALLPKSFGVLWNYKGSPGYADLTMPDGRLLIQFGNTRFGSVPYVNDVVVITYAVTEGADGNNEVLIDKPVFTDAVPSVSGKVLENPTGGTNEKPITVYKNVSSGSFGTYESSVTRPQYIAAVSTYPGIVDAVTQAQREIDPMDLQWMNVIRVTALTSSPWTQRQKKDFLRRMQDITMYAPRFFWVDAIPVDRDIEVEVYFFNTAILSEGQAKAEKAIIDLLAPKPGILMTNHFESDIDTAIKKGNPGQVSYIKMIRPTSGEMIVTAPDSPDTTYSFIPGGAVQPMEAGIYAYSVAVTTDLDAGPPNGWVFPQITNSMGEANAIRLEWPEVRGAIEYTVYGRIGGYEDRPLGVMAVIPANPAQTHASFIDDGSITPSGVLPPSVSKAPIRYNRIRNLVVKPYYSSRQNRLSTQ